MEGPMAERADAFFRYSEKFGEEAKMTENDVMLRGIQARLDDLPDCSEEMFYVVEGLCRKRGLPEPSDEWSRDRELAAAIHGFHLELVELLLREDTAPPGSAAEQFARRQREGCLDRFERYIKG
jgi:hypothetical protein